MAAERGKDSGEQPDT